MIRNGDLKLYLAEHDPQHHAWAKRGIDRANLHLKILLSYWYYKDTDLDALFEKYFTEPYPEVFADSGAFSAMTQGVTITPKEYGDWIKRWQHHFTVYSNLDVIKDAEGTWRNQQILEDMGLEPLPCFHVLEDWRWLEHYVERYPYIALGVAGMQSRKDAIMAWLVRCYQIAQDRAVFHGFALTSWQVMSTFPWYSVDSSSWGQGFRFGRVPVFDDHKGCFIKLRLGDHQGWQKHAPLVRRLGFDPADFADRKRNDRAKICAISALSYMLAEQWLRQRHGEVKIPHRAGATGDRLYLSDTSNGINSRDTAAAVKTGVKIHLADARGPNGGDLAAADAGFKAYLVDSPHTPLRDTAAASSGLRTYLADGGGLGDTSRVMEILSDQKSCLSR